MKEINNEDCVVQCGQQSWSALKTFLDSHPPSSLFVLVDENTEQHCLPYAISQLPALEQAHIISITAGEEHKNIDSCNKVWNALSSLGGDRKSLLINLGGGVVTDLGGFVACTFRRGIRFINIPTSLLAMVDASVGGKNGVDLGHLKNQIGIIKNPERVLVDLNFLNTLPSPHLISGWAEMLKHGIIHSKAYWEGAKKFDLQQSAEAESLIWQSIVIKNEVVTEDPTEQGLRKTLNYGHTLGHAIESYCLDDNAQKPLLHGEAIAIGMVLATYLSQQLFQFPEDSMHEISSQLRSIYGKVHFTKTDIDQIIKLLAFDKKNTHGKVLFVLMSDFGKYQIDVEVPNSLIYDAFNFYDNLT